MTKKLDIPKNNIEILIHEDCELNYLWYPQTPSELNTKIKFVHSKPHLKSRIKFQLIMSEDSKADLEITVKVPRESIGTDTFLKIEVLALSENIHTRIVPSLEILNKEVKGGHSATITYFDLENIYYLQSKGLSLENSKNLLIDAFIKN